MLIISHSVYFVKIQLVKTCFLYLKMVSYGKGGDEMAEEKKKHPDLNHGKQKDQKMKPYLVYDYLMRNTDTNNVATIKSITDYLKDELGIYAERRSVYKDIEAINEAILLTTRNSYGIPKASNIEVAKRLLNDDKNKTIIYDEHRKGYYVRKRHYKVKDIRILAECIYSAKFIDEDSSNKLINVICDLVSDQCAESIKRDVLLLDRVKTDNTDLYDMVGNISAAMSRKRNKTTHIPEKIRFKYMEYIIQNGLKRTERRKGEWYIVSPYKIVINDGNYYLIGYDDKMKKIVNYRVDRMKDLELTGEPRSGEEDFKALNIETYLQENFNMYNGKREHVTIRALNMLLDTFIDRFGKENVIYAKDDDKHFTAIVTVSVSNQFFGWLCGFGNKVKILSPSQTAEEFKAYLDKMRGMYE